MSNYNQEERELTNEGDKESPSSRDSAFLSDP